MQRVLVESTTLAFAGHDAWAAVLELQFCNGAVYQYFHVPRRSIGTCCGLNRRAVTFTTTFEADIPSGGFKTLLVQLVP
jgi:KTSC domain-containing protein